MRRLPLVLLILALPALAAASDHVPPVTAKLDLRVADTAFADFNGDGRVDLVSAGGCPGRPCFSIVLNRASGLAARPRFGTKETGPAFTDIAAPDRGTWIVALDGTKRARIVRGVATSAPRATPFPLPRAADLTAVGDFNGDDSPDLVFIDAQTNAGFAALGDASKFVLQKQFFETGQFVPTDVATGDFDDDGDDDLAIAGGRRLTIFTSAGDGTFGFPVGVGLGGANYVLAVNDFQADASPDLAVGTSTGIRLFETSDPGPSGGIEIEPGPVLTGTAPVGVVLGDVNRDNLVDLIALNRGSATISTFVAGPGGGYGMPIRSTPIGANPISISLVRFDNDGIPDVIVANGPSGGLGSTQVLLGDGKGAFRVRDRTPTPTTPGALPFGFTLAWNHPSPNQGFSFLCADITAVSGGTLTLAMTGPDGSTLQGTLQLKNKPTATARGTFSFRIEQYGRYTVRITATKGGTSVTKTETITVTAAQGSAGCSG